jgi:hypothetical protein
VKEAMCGTYVKLPSLQILTRILACNDYDELADFTAQHPLTELAHELLDVGFDLVVGSDQNIEAILFYGGEIFSWVHSALEENGVDRVFEEFGDELCGA